MRLDARITQSTIRNFPSVPIYGGTLRVVDAALNEQFSFQFALHADVAARISVSAVAPEGWSVRIRRVGLVPMSHHNTGISHNRADLDGIGQIPGLVPDPLFDESFALVGESETVSFWFTVVPAEDAKPGKYEISVQGTLSDISDPSKPIGYPVSRVFTVKLHNIRIAPRHDFDVTHWLYCDCLIDRYGTDLFDERFWEIAGRYFRDVVAHGQNVIYVPLFTPPLDSDKRPSQLLKVTRVRNGKYAFDWADVRRYVETAKKCGLEKFEWCHLFGQWGCRTALRVYKGQGRDEMPLWPADTPATSPTYRSFLAQLLPEFRKFLEEEGIFEKSLFHLSDEPNGDEAKENYRAAKAMMSDLAPWMRFCDAVSHLDFGKEGLVDTPVPTVSTALDFLDAGIDCWCYYCCGPREDYLQHLMDTPLSKIAMHGFVLYRWPVRGFLHWGLNYWNRCQTREPIDPFSITDAGAWQRGWAYGDPFLVYPGKDGPIDSIRWEIFGEAMQDYALLQTLDIDRNCLLLDPIRDFHDFPKSPSWRLSSKRRLYAIANRRAAKAGL